MAKVQTVMGDIDPEEIGITLIHEHLFYDTQSNPKDGRQFLDLPVQLQEIESFQTQGGNCIVDQTTIDLGRQPNLLKRLAEAAKLHVVASTGFYHEQWFPQNLHNYKVDDIARIMIKEIKKNIDGVNFRAGLIGEIGSSEMGTTPSEAKVLQAAALAHRETGAPISTHTMAGSEALHQISIFKKENVNLGKVIISHVDLDHVEHIRMIAEQGVFLGIDTIGKPRYRDQYRLTGDEIRMEVILALVKAGYEDQIMLSHDISRTSYLHASGGRGYSHLLGTFVPELKKRLSADIIDKFLVQNPRRALSF